MTAGLAVAALVFGCLLASAADAAQSRFFTASDGTRLHYLEAGPATANTIVFVPGWTMPAWIWQPQIDALSARYHVIAFDPRGQGQSQIAAAGYEPDRRGRDLEDLIETQGGQPVLLVGWSLGVLDALSYVAQCGDARIAGLVLVDNSIGENPPPIPGPPRPRPKAPKPPREEARAAFVKGMFHRQQSPDYLERLTRASLQLPEPQARALLAYAKPRSYWRDAVYSTKKPVLYVIRPRWQGQAANLLARHADAESVLFETAGHALFVDEPQRFNAVLTDFIGRKVWP
ncbi:microsomal epoxide hydrolase [Caulobacter ginsengisoli]|uniref:Microsomal epoxide hydrolase n=1 Tax=Caulobacter ginsengisoli TaxID=400775 RepID=A0ABU0IU49_9CAUL|nr:alpha/beta hydrolase [Caulobacter ginsengisoli]MDQ0464940.1 microsomal epoxide hydrolase [Caulobacter ginsengisoli]